MGTDGNRTLTDEQMTADYRTDVSFLPRLLKEVTDLEERIKNNRDDEDVQIPVATLRRMSMGMRSMYKSETETVGIFGLGDSNRGDRGANCNYNPFNKVDIGDII